MNHDSYPDDYIRDILKGVKTIAMVGVSANMARPSYIAFKYLLGRGYRMIGVNPGLAGKTLLGAPIFAKLADIGEPIDMVDIFRNSEAAGPIIDEVLRLEPKPRAIWMQLTVRNDEAAARAEAQGVEVVMTGVNSRILSSKKPQLMRGFQKFGIDRK
jgi:predicted CoA-binding protein